MSNPKLMDRILNFERFKQINFKRGCNIPFASTHQNQIFESFKNEKKV